MVLVNSMIAIRFGRSDFRVHLMEEVPGGGEETAHHLEGKGEIVEIVIVQGVIVIVERGIVFVKQFVN